MDLARRTVRGRRVFEDLDHEDVVEGRIRKRKSARDIVNQDVGRGELGGNVESLILHVARQVLAKIAVACADVEYAAAREYLRRLQVRATHTATTASAALVGALVRELRQ